MRNGIYTIYMGKEYEAGVKDDNSFILRSLDSNDTAKGFSLYMGIVYTKTVRRSELKEVYRISTIAEFKGNKFQVLKEAGDNILLSSMSGDYRVYESLGMDAVDRGVYQKWINKNDVTALLEEKTSI